jgi:hypothetical protein
MAMNPQNPADLLATYRAAFGTQQPPAQQTAPASIASGPAVSNAHALSQLVAALQAAKKQPSRHIRNMEPGNRDHGAITSAGHMPPPKWMSEG